MSSSLARTDEHRARRSRIVLPIGAITAAALAVLGWLALASARTMDERYVHQTTYERTRLLDSLTGVSDRRELLGRLSRMDSSLIEIRSILRGRRDR